MLMYNLHTENEPHQRQHIKGVGSPLFTSVDTVVFDQETKYEKNEEKKDQTGTQATVKRELGISQVKL